VTQDEGVAPPGTPASEAARLAALESYAILDTPREREFDDVVRLAAQICETPIAVVNLVGAERQWFKAEQGLGVSETPLDISICAKAILQPGLCVVPDLALDPSFDTNPLVTGDPKLRFYAGALLETPEGLPIGTLCVLDTKPRPQGLSEAQGFALTALARQVMGQFELRKRGAALAVSEERLRLIVETATDYAILTIDQARIVTSWSAGAAATFGFAADEIVGRSADLLFTPEDIAGGRPQVEVDEARRNGRAADVRWHQRKDGSRVFVNGVVRPLRDELGQEIGFLKVGRDETEARRADDAQREANERYRLVARATNDTIWDWDLLGDRIAWNESLHNAHGHAPAGMETSSAWWLDRIHPDDRARIEASIGAVIESESSAWVDGYRFCRADGSFAEIIDRGHVLRDAWGRAVRMVGAMLDRTQAKQAEAELALATESLRLATDAAEVGIWDLDLTTNVLNWSNRTKAAFGISPDVPCSMDDFYAGLHPEDREATARAFASAINPEQRASYDVVYRTIGKEDGLTRWVEARGRGLFDEDGRCIRAIGTAIDITERRAAEERLRLSETALATTTATLEALLAYAPIGFGFFDRGRRYVRLNATLAAINGRPLDDHIGRTVEEIIPATAAEVARAIDRVVAEGRSLGGIEVDGETPASPGEIRSWLTSFFPVFGASGAVDYVGVTVIDITERRRAEAAVKELNRTLEARVADRTAERDRMWRLSTDLMLVAHLDSTVVAINPAWTSLLGWVEEDLIGRPFLEFVHPDDLAATVAEAGELAQGVATYSFQNRYRHKDGSYRWLSWTAVTGEEFIHGAARDITAERQAQEQLAEAQEALRQSQKMEAMGQLTGGVAHDFNNLLTPIVGSLDMLQRKGLGGAREQRLIAGAMQSADRAKTLVQRLLAFARRQPLQPTAVDVGRLVAGMADLLASTTGPQVKVMVDVASDLPPAQADPNQLEMALLNLGVNARDAMPDGGTLRIKASAETVAPSANPSLAPGIYVRLSVADTGIGMDQATLTRAVEPFFSTKGVGHGTGLGLSMAHGLALQLGGALTIDSRLGEGTDVALWLPKGSEEADELVSAPATGHERFAGTVLLVDDEELVRLSTADMLTDLGYQVVEAGSGEQALKLIADGLRPNLLVTDHLMPGMTGTQLARAARGGLPGLPVLLVSGYAERDGIEPDLPRLTKPFRNAELAESLASLASAGSR
jgi:PAS domain S-box-containing protein